jgi:hypothetical protein
MNLADGELRRVVARHPLHGVERPGPASSISPMWLTSKSPARVRTARCSSLMPDTDGHVPAAEFDHARAAGAVRGIERSLLELRRQLDDM